MRSFSGVKRLVFKNFSQDHLSSEHHKKCVHEQLGILANNGSVGQQNLVRTPGWSLG